MRSCGQVAYEAYAEARGWKAHDDLPLPAWDDVKAEIQDAWEVAAAAVADLC